jgi:hypothetical protein
MKTKRSRKPTNKALQKVIQEMQYRVMATQSQVNSLTEIFSDFLDFTNKKPKFVEYLKAKQKQKSPGSVENPEVKQEELV